MANQDTELLVRIRTDLGRVLGDLNQVGGGVGDVGRSAQQSTSRIASMMAALSSLPSFNSIRITAGMDAAGRSAADARAEIERMAAANQAAQAAMNDARGVAAAGSFGATSAAVAGLKAQLLGLVAVYKLLEGAKSVVGTAADLQDTETRLKSLTGSAEKYAETEQYLTETAKALHKEYFTLANSYNGLLALQKNGVITQKEGRTILEGLADASSELGVSNADLSLSMRGIIQQLGNANVQWDEMRQATDSMPGLLDNIANASGLTKGELKAMSDAGTYTTAMFRDHLIKALKNYKGASERTAGNIHAQYTDIENAYTELVKVLEEPISDALTPMLKGIASAISYIANGPSLEAKIKQLNDSAKAIERYKAAGEKIPVALQNQFNSLQGDINAAAKAKETAAKNEDKQDEKDEADRQASEAKKGLADSEDWYAETVIADEKKIADAKEAASKKAQSAAESATKSAQSKAEAKAKAYASEREAVAKNIEQLNFELAALKLSDNERAIQTKVRSLSAKATDDERSAIEAKVRALDKETTAQQRQQAMWEQSVKDANAAYDQRKSNADMIKFGDVQGGFNDALIKTREQLDHGIITPEQFKAETEKLGRAYNENFIDPAKSGVSQLSEFSVQAARNMQSAFADFLFDPFENGMEGMAANFAKIVQRMVAEAASAQIFETLLGKNYGQSNATGGLLSALFSGVAGAVGGAFGGGEAVSVAAGNSAAFSNTMTDFQWMPKQFHTGGIIGQGGRSVNADPALFSSATRYHSGGIPGLKPNEVPIIALNNEEVLTADDPRHRNNLSKTTANGSKSDGIDITTHVTVAADNQSAGDMGNKLGDMVNAAVRQVIVTEKRPGGLLAKGS
jgi:tape measure domain-containing protein